MEKLIILADRGTLKAYKLDHSRTQGRPHIEEVEEVDVVSGNTPISEKTTHQQGRHPDKRRGQVAMEQMSTSEAQGLEAEEERKSIAEIQDQINRLLARHSSLGWSFAAPSTINEQILNGIDPDKKDRLLENLDLNLTNQPKDEVKERFA